MKAIVLSNPGKQSTNSYKDLPIPELLLGHVVIEIKAFSLNHAEFHMRKGEWAEADEVSGLECCGIVHSCPGGEFVVGSKVGALMGGMGRTIHGSYAEYTRVSVNNVASIDADLSWEDVVAIPESYSTAWTFLFRNLEFASNQMVLIWGGTSALGQAAINLAVNCGAKVIATARTLSRSQLLLDQGFERVELERPNLSEHLPEKKSINAVRNLVGNVVLLDSMAIVRRGGHVCHGGWLGGLAPIQNFNPLLEMPSGVQFSFFGSFHFGTPGFPVSDVPLSEIAREVAAGRYNAKPVKVFQFEEIDKAHEALEEEGRPAHNVVSSRSSREVSKTLSKTILLGLS